jgi:CheY-like chemotaxis protein/DNA-directed RNA polymerase subunit M/transcription elongation factor TFIIS
VSARIKIVCPKCKAKLKFAAEKLISDVVKLRCPGCKTENKIQETEVNNSEPKEEILDVDRHLESGTGFVEDDLDEQDLKSNLRKFKRVKFKKKVLVDNQIMVEALDISENGLFLHTGRSFDDDSIVELGIPTLPGNFDLKVQAIVKHNHRGIGMGMQFVDLDDKQKVQLAKLINSLDESARKELEGRKIILLAGGSDTARNINKSKLVLDGFYVLQATNADQVFEILQNETPDVMVLDWQETSFNSKGLLAQIRQKPQYKNVIIIVLSALTDSSASAQREILDGGAEMYMAKMDTNPAKLSQALSALIEERDTLSFFLVKNSQYSQLFQI